MTTAPERTHYRALVAEIATKAKAKLPECNGRVDKAVALVLAGDVAGQEGDGSWRVGSCTDPLVTHRVSGTSCSCDDNQYGKAPRGLCKHVLAVMMQMRVQELLPQAPAVEWPPDEELAVESGTEVHPVSTSTLPEAPASVNVRLMIAGRDCQLTLRGVSEAEVLTRLEAVLRRYPVSTPPASLSPTREPELEKRYCPRHGVEMQLNHKDGRSWHSHQTDKGWCKGK
jgi:hypothetical protein